VAASKFFSSSLLLRFTHHKQASMYWPEEDESVKAHFDADIKNVHLLYDYAAKNPETGEQGVKGRYCYRMLIFLPLIQAPMKSGSMKCGSTMRIE
jgi:hypothetical protein